MVFEAGDGQMGEDAMSVLPAVVVDGFGVAEFHIEEFGEFADLIGAIHALRVTVHLLQGDHMGENGADDLGNAVQVEFLVHAFAVVDIIGQECDPVCLSGDETGAAEK